MRRYKDETIESALQLYKDGNSAVQVSKIIGANEATIRSWLKRNNMDIRDGGYYNQKYSKDIFDKIKKLYLEGYYTTDIEKVLGLPRGIPSYLLRKNNVELNHRGPKSMIGKEDYFDIIDTEKKAYYLGWLIADGNISVVNNQYCIKVGIALNDKEIIENFINDIESKNAIQIYNGKYPSARISLTSVHMYEALTQHGLIPRKSGKEVFPSTVPQNLINHFIRGVFDGDGITDVSKLRSGFCGSRDMMEKILQNINYSKSIRLFQNKKSKEIYYFLGGKKFSNHLYNFIYSDATIWLKRKRDRLKYICDTRWNAV